jgi:hypothetical protein
MHYVIESIFVGAFTAFLYWILSILPILPILSILPILLFVIGFIKHYAGYYLLHDYYCTYGDACISYHMHKRKEGNIMIESLLEGGAFVIVGLTLSYFVHKRSELFFLVGFLLHILSEVSGLHTHFCRDLCE